MRDLGQRIGSRITVIRADGVVIADSARDPDAMHDHGSRPEIVASREVPFGHAVRLSDTPETRMVYVARSVRVDGAIVGQVRAAQPLLSLAERLAILRGTIVGAVVIAVALALLGALLVARRLAQPLRVMTRAAAKLATVSGISRTDVHEAGLRIVGRGLLVAPGSPRRAGSGR